MPDRAIPILSFFSGAGGLDYGFRQEGFKILLACDNFAAAVRTYNFNSKSRTAEEKDLSELTRRRLYQLLEKKADGRAPSGVVGGPPCQGFSRGNAQADPNDPRNHLPFTYVDRLEGLTGRYDLRFFVFENVMCLRAPRHRQRFEAICRAFEDAGYHIFPKELDAQDFGVAQLRRRLFIVGLRKKYFGRDAFTFPTGTAPRVTVRDAIQGLPPPVFFQRGMKASAIQPHPNHWTMRPKSAKLSGGTPTDGRSFRKLNWDDVSPTVAYGNREIHVHPDGGRRLSIHEAMLLQGFPRTYRLTGNFSEQVTQVSNAVPPPVARALARRIREVLAKRAKE